MRVLIVEDNGVYGQLLVERLERAGFDADLCDTVANARAALRRVDYAALLLDLGLPDDDGLTLLREQRTVGSVMPIIVMTARNGLEDRLAGLQGGADDYVVKPFYFDELLARLHTLLRRPVETPETVLRAGNVQLDADGHVLRVSGAFVHAGAREIELLELLLRLKDRVVTRGQLAIGLFGGLGEQSSNAVDVYVHRLRKVLEDAHATINVHTIRGVGYLMMEKRQDIDPDAREAKP